MLNLVLDEGIEYLRDPKDSTRLTEATRKVGLTVCRGTAVVAVAPNAGFEPIDNPCAAAEGAEGATAE